MFIEQDYIKRILREKKSPYTIFVLFIYNIMNVDRNTPKWRSLYEYLSGGRRGSYSTWNQYVTAQARAFCSWRMLERRVVWIGRWLHSCPRIDRLLLTCRLISYEPRQPVDHRGICSSIKPPLQTHTTDLLYNVCCLVSLVRYNISYALFSTLFQIFNFMFHKIENVK